MSETNSSGPSDPAKCPLCRGAIEREYFPSMTNIDSADRIKCDNCGPFLLRQMDEVNAKYSEEDRIRLGILLRERILNALPMPLLVFDPDYKLDIPGSVPVYARDLLRTWPNSVPERIDRCLVNLVNYGRETHGGSSSVGQTIEIRGDRYFEFVLFAQDHGERSYMINTLHDFGWVENAGSHSKAHVLRISPLGWEHYDELRRGRANVNNPAFVAMWFGGDHREEEMLSLFDNAIRPACMACGWRAKRVDTDEHNEPIVDKLVTDITAAPFVIAELTSNNEGVYYEAGFAKGLGKIVIYCCPEQGKEPHFDVRAINQVRWKDKVDLRTKLEDRIRATMGDGPHPVTKSRSGL